MAGRTQLFQPGTSPASRPESSGRIRLKRLLAAVVMSLALGCLPIDASIEDPGPPYEESIRRSRQALTRGNIEAAVSYLDHALRLNPEHSAAFWQLGQAYIHTGRYSDAATALERGFQLERDGTRRKVAILQDLAFALHLAERDEAAIQALRQVIQARPGTTGLHLMLGRIYLGVGRLDLARAEFRKEIALAARADANPAKRDSERHLAAAISGLGAAAYRQGEYRTAIRVLGERNSLEALLHAGLAMAANEQYEEAAGKLRAALRIDPDHRSALQNMARCAAALGRDRERDELLDRLLDIYRKDQEEKARHSRIGNMLTFAMHKIRSGDRAGAAASLKKVPRQPPLSMKLLLELGRLQYEAGSHLESESSFREILSRQPLQPQPYFWLGRIQEDRGNLADAAVLLKRSIQLSPVETEYHGHLARIYFSLERPTDAIGELRLATRLRPDDASGHYNLGKGLLRTETLVDVATELEAAVRLGHEGAGIHEILLEVYRREGNAAGMEKERIILERIRSQESGPL